jgi:putative ABC transport system permease protein
MIWKHLQIALRILKKNKLHSVINVLSLSLAAACSLLLFVYLRYEWTWDHHHENLDSIYLVKANQSFENGFDYSTDGTSMLFKESVQRNIPGIKAVCTFEEESKSIVIDEESYPLEVTFVNREFFDVFSFPFLEGNRESLFETQNSAVVTREFAEKYSPFEDPIGKEIDINFDSETKSFLITAIAESVPKTSILSGEVFLSMKVHIDEYLVNNEMDWISNSQMNFALLEKGADPLEVEASIKSLMDDLGVSHNKEKNIKTEFILHPLNKYHVRLPFLKNPHDFGSQIDSKPSLILAGIALVILFMACINVTMLSIGRGKVRSREIGVRKVLGARRNELMTQFWLETAILVVAALGIGLVLTELFLPVFNGLINLSLSMSYDFQTFVVLASLFVTLLIAAGFYPALVLSSFPVMSAFKGLFNAGKKKKLRRVTVVIQFTSTITLIAITLTMGQQLNFIKNQDLGYNDEQVVAFPMYSEGNDGLRALERFKNDFAGEPGVLGVAGSSCLFGEGWIINFWYDDDEQRRSYFSTIDQEFLTLLNVEFVEGRNFSKDKPSDEKRGVIVNEAFVEEFGIDNPIGARIGYFAENEIIGVMKDFNHDSLHEEVASLMMVMNPDIVYSQRVGCGRNHHHTIQYIYAKLAPEKIVSTMASIEKYWAKTYPETEYKFHFLDESVQEMYVDERRWNRTITFSSIIAILIASMGLFGLAELQISQRMKEIGVRKVLGASATQLVSQFNKEFVILVTGSTILAVPITIYILNKWFENFAYHVNINPLILIGAGFIALMIAFVTTSTQSIRAANTNPIEVLRDE